MVDLDWYRSFMATYRVGTVTGAAEERGLTQPAVTQHLAALEAAAGEPLFVRTPRRMVPTERGKVLYSQVAQALEMLEQVSQGLRRHGATALPLVRLGAPREYFTEVALARLGLAPLRVWAQFGVARSLADALQHGDLDLVIATERIGLRDVEYRKLGEETFVLVGGPDAQPPVAQAQTPEECAALERWLIEQPWISYASDLPIIRRFWRQQFGRRAAITPRMIIPDLGSIAQAVALGLGLSVLPTYLCAEAVAVGRLRYVWEPPLPVTNDLWLAYRTQDRQRPEVVAALAALRT